MWTTWGFSTQIPQNAVENLFLQRIGFYKFMVVWDRECGEWIIQ